MANTVIQLKKSGTPSSVPNSLANGELAINYADGKLFYKDSTGVIKTVSVDAYSTVNVGGSLLVADIPNDVLSIGAGDNIVLTPDILTDSFTVAANLTAANNWANTKLSNTSGVVFGGNLTISTDLTIGNNLYSINSAFFDTTTTVAGVAKGQIVWNSDDETFDMGMANDSVLQVGQEIYYRVKNQSGSTINLGTVVMSSGTLGASGRILVTPAISDGTYPSKYLMGIATSAITNGGEGYITHFGKVRGLDTSMWSEGDILYANTSVAGALQNTMPSAPNTKTTVAIVVSKHASTGTLFVRPTYGSKLNEDELVELHSLANGDVIQYVSANGRFENKNTLVSAYDRANSAWELANTANSKGGGSSVVTTSDTAPSSPSDGTLWWNSNVGKLFVYYDDGTSSQWTETTGGYIYSAEGIAKAAFDTANSAFAKANTGGNTFSAFAVSGQTSITATSTTDVVTFASNGGINIETNSSTKTVYITQASTIDYGLITGSVTASNDYGSIA